MHTHSVSIGEAYYQAMSQKDLNKVASYVHEDIDFSTPLGGAKGKEEFLGAVKGFMNNFKNLHVQSVFEKGKEATIVYEISCPAPINQFRAVAFMTFEDDLIKRLELFYDARPFEALQREIFEQKS